METFLDILWLKIITGFQYTGESLYYVLSSLHFFGPAFVISLLAVITVCITKWLNRVIITKRFIKLEKEFQHWFNLRQEALTCEDPEIGKRMARNIDQAQLNRAYYDYFFEGLLLGIVRKIIPIFFIFAFINEFYQPEKLTEIFGNPHIFTITSTQGEPVPIGAPFWYLISLVSMYLIWWLVKKSMVKKAKKQDQNLPVAVTANG